MEILDVVDEDGKPTGETVERTYAHKNGIRHRTSHVWIGKIINGEVYLLLQRRSEDKDSHPGCLDISSAGHIPAGCTYMESALRELHEELGIKAEYSDLHYVGKRRKAYKKIFHGENFFDNQVSNVYVIFKDVDIADILYQKSEVSEVMFMRLSEVYKMVDEEEKALNFEEGIISDNRNNNKSCIAFEEIKMLNNYINDHREILLNSF